MASYSPLTVIENFQHSPAQSDLDKCVHCGLCLNACPTYRESGLEMDSPRGRIFLMKQVASGQPIDKNYVQHLDLCLACRGCETACPSGVPYGRLIESARDQIETERPHSLVAKLVRKIVFDKLLPSRSALQMAGAALYLYQASGAQKVFRLLNNLGLFGKLGRLEALAPSAQVPFFYSKVGRTYRTLGERRYRVAFLSGCVANVCFARLNEATVRVLQRNGCEVDIPGAQTCCGALHVHSGLRGKAQELARRNIDAINPDEYDAILTNAAGCGSTLKEYDELLGDDAAYRDRAMAFKSKVQDINRFLSAIELNENMGFIDKVVTYQDSCHLAHGQKIRLAPRKLLRAIPGLEFREMSMSDVCCGSAGVYNVVQSDMADSILRSKMEAINQTRASIIATANPGCMLQLTAGVRLYGKNQRVVHVVELLDEAYRNFAGQALVKVGKS